MGMRWRPRGAEKTITSIIHGEGDAEVAKYVHMDSVYPC